MNNFTLLLIGLSLCLCLPTNCVAQVRDSASQVYKVNPWITGGLATTGLILNSIGLQRIVDKDPIPEDRVYRLDKNDVNAFDRLALTRNPDRKKRGEDISDLGMQIGIISPIFLFLDRDIRSDWLDISLMYLEAQALTATTYSWGPFGPNYVERIRPISYYEEFPLEERNFGGLRNSFYSGHVASATTGIYFSITVFADYHPGFKEKKWLAYSLAALPSFAIGYFRVEALKHYPSDVLVGYLVGAASGILIPHFHRKWKKRAGISIRYDQSFKGLGFKYRF